LDRLLKERVIEPWALDVDHRRQVRTKKAGRNARPASVFNTLAFSDQRELKTRRDIATNRALPSERATHRH
jgi:hypothetical protein